MKKYYHSLNHARVSVYRVTQNKNFRNFLIRPELLFEEEILFVYNDIDGKEIEDKNTGIFGTKEDAIKDYIKENPNETYNQGM